MVDSIEIVNDSSYLMRSENDPDKMYLIDTDLWICECHTGQSGAVCKHQYLVWIHKKKNGTAFLPLLSPSQRKEYAYLAYLANIYLITIMKDCTHQQKQVQR